MRRNAITRPTTTRELVQRMDNARGPVSAARSDGERAAVERRIALQFPVERQTAELKLALIANTNTPQDFNIIMSAAEQLRQTARENPQRFGMSVAEAAAALGASSRYVERLIEAGKLRSEKLAGMGPRLFIDADDVARLKAEREAAGKLRKKGTDSQ
jgi:excisionase family DNA binding protein